MRVNSVQIIKLLLGLSVLLPGFPGAVWATEYSSTNFKVRDPDLNIGGSQGATSGSFSGSGTTGQEVIGESSSAAYKIKSGFQYFDETDPVLASFCDAPTNTLRVCDGSTYGSDTDTTTSADALTAQWSGDGVSSSWSDAESGIYSFEYSIKRVNDGNFWSGSSWSGTQTRFGTQALTVTHTGIQLEAGKSYKFVARAVSGGGLFSTEQESDGVTVEPALTLTINGVAVGQVIKSGITTTVATSNGLSLNFGTLTVNTSALAAHDLTVSTNSSQGYFVRARVDRQLTCDACSGTPTIPAFSGTNDTPASWGSSTGFGYTVNNRSVLSDLSLDTPTRFDPSDVWAGFSTATSTSNNAEVAYNQGPETATTRIGYQIRIGSTQATGTYTNQIIYLATVTY